MLKKIGNKVVSLAPVSGAKKAAAAVGTFATFVAVQAHAALPTEATTAFNTMKSDGQEVVGLVWGGLAFFTGAWFLMKIMKKGANKMS